MSEIMSAEKFADYIDNNCLLFCYGEVEGLYITKTIEAICSRDATIIEKCKEAINNSTGKRCIDPEDGNPYLVDIPEWAKLQAYDILDSVLAEIEEE